MNTDPIPSHPITLQILGQSCKIGSKIANWVSKSNKKETELRSLKLKPGAQHLRKITSNRLHGDYCEQVSQDAKKIAKNSQKLNASTPTN